MRKKKRTAPKSSPKKSVLTLSEAHKFRKLFMEEEINCIDRTITVLGNNQLSMLVFGLGIVVVLAIEKSNNISILLQGARFTQVAEHGPFYLARFHAAAQLGQG